VKWMCGWVEHFAIVMLAARWRRLSGQGLYREVVKPVRLVMAMDHSELPDEWHDMVNPRRDKWRETGVGSTHASDLEEQDGKNEADDFGALGFRQVRTRC